MVPAHLIIHRDLRFVDLHEDLKLELCSRNGRIFAFLDAFLNVLVGKAGVNRDDTLIGSLSSCAMYGHHVDVRGRRTHRHFEIGVGRNVR